MDDNKKELSREEKLSLKYIFIKHKIIEHYDRGCRYLNIAKMVAIIFFILLTIVFIISVHNTGDYFVWLCRWLGVMVFDMFVFLILEYVKYLISSKLIPYLNDDEQLEFGEYEVLMESDDDDDEDEEEDE